MSTRRDSYRMAQVRHPPKQPNSASLARLFETPEHQPFALSGGVPAAVVIHGFPGTPAETRSLGQALHQAGWTVHGLLLPGFGPQLASLGQRRYADWVAAASQALQTLQQDHQPTLLVGFSMGAAVATLASAQTAPDGLVLLAPFTGQVGLLGPMLPIMRRLLPTIRPFRLFRPDFSNPDMRKGMANFLPTLDLDDPAVQQSLAELAIPTSILDEVRRAGQAAWRAGPAIRVPTLVVQGANDAVVRPAMTRKFVARLAGPARYQDLPASHDLLDATRPAWAQISQSVVRFAHELQEHN